MLGRLSIHLHAVSVRRGSRWALRDVSMRLNAGERCALIGGNGAGKTQLLKVLSTAVWPTPTGREARTYRLGRRPVDLIEARQHIAYVGAEMQDKYTRYDWNPSVASLLATGIHGTDLLLQRVTAAQSRKIHSFLELCGLRELASRSFLSLSYGQKRVALLARALVREPDWLLLDEFYNGLDAEYRQRIDTLLQFVVRRGQGWVSSAHRAMDVPSGTQRLLELRAGRIVANKRMTVADLKSLAARAGDPVHRVRQPLEGRLQAQVPADATPKRSARRLMRIVGADLYVDYRCVLRDLDWELRTGEQWAIVGANGAGKSSFLKLLYGDLSPALGGTIERSGFPKGSPISAWKRCVGLVSPELQTDYAVDVTVLTLVASGRYASIGLCDPPSVADHDSALHWLKFFSLTAVAKRRPRELSYGQLRRALFARALSANPKILLMDEPLTGLDPRQRASMKRLFQRLMARGLSLVIAVHHAEDLPRGMTHALHLHNELANAIDLRSAT